MLLMDLDKKYNFRNVKFFILVIMAMCFLFLGFLNISIAKEVPIFKGGFETGNEHQWDELHYNKRLNKNRQFTIVTNPVRDGRYSAKMVVNNGDGFEQTGGERSDLKRSALYDEKEGDEYWYAWSTFFPKDWQAPKEWFVFADWHSRYDDVCQLLQLEVTTENALLARVLTGDVSGYQCFNGNGSAFTTDKVIAKTLNTSMWNDFIIHVKWTTQATGIIEIFHKTERQENFTKVFDLRKIPTLQYQADSNYPASPYFKLAHYRSSKNTHTSTLYHDGFRQGKTRQSIVSGNLYRLEMDECNHTPSCLTNN